MERVIFIKTRFHGDDFGINLKQTEHFIDCYKNGVLNEISVIVNSDYYFECFNMIKNDIKKYNLDFSIHLNLTEGKSILYNNYLTNEDGYFKCGFIKLLFMTFNKKKYKNIIKDEIREQIKRYIEMTGDSVINIDSHQHVHMIPIVFESVIEVIDEFKLNIGYIRVPIDNMSIILCTPSIWFKIKPINAVKWLLLKMLYLINKKYFDKYNKRMFFGLLFSCSMKKEYIDKLLFKYKKHSLKCNRDIEIMFHPGYIDRVEGTLNKRNDKLSNVLMSKNRLIEKEVLIDIKKCKVN